MEVFDQRYEKQKLLGRGAFSEVWKVRDMKTGVVLALKIYHAVGGTDENGAEMMTREFALMVNISHKNLLRPLFYNICEHRPYLILPYCEKGNIESSVGKMSEDDAWHLLRDCASALAYLHSQKPSIIHQDIKPANILKGDNGDYMLTDFGISTQMKTTLSHVSNEELELFASGTIAYMAPERFSRNNLPIMSNDVYSLGATTYEMLTGDPPFGNDGGLLQKRGADIPELQGDFSPLLKKVLEWCMQLEPSQRPTAAQLNAVADDAIRNPQSRWQESSLGGEQLSDTTVPIPNRKKWFTIIGIMLPFIIAGSVGFWWWQETDRRTVSSEETPLQVLQSEEDKTYDYSMMLISHQSADSVHKALNSLEKLAFKGHRKAIHEVAYTYAWISNLSSESVRRKRLLGWNIDANGLPVSNDINHEAIEWIEKCIQTSDSTDYQALYWLSYYYINGIVHHQNLNYALTLLNKARLEAGKFHDESFQETINNDIKIVKGIKNKQP